MRRTATLGMPTPSPEQEAVSIRYGNDWCVAFTPANLFIKRHETRLFRQSGDPLRFRKRTNHLNNDLSSNLKAYLRASYLGKLGTQACEIHDICTRMCPSSGLIYTRTRLASTPSLPRLLGVIWRTDVTLYATQKKEKE